MAIKSQGARIQVATASGTAVNITGATQANPVVITSSSHGQANGTVGVITGVGGMTQLNNRAFIVANTATNTFELRGVNGTGYSAYTSGGTFTPQTMTTIGEVRSFSGFDGEASELDATHLLSLGKEWLLGLQDPGSGTLNVFYISDAGQTRLRALKESGNAAAFTITFSDGRMIAFMALVKSFTIENVEPDNIVMSTVSLRITNAESGHA
ncbi:MAG: phage tail tube protein [Gammaproteobacteria bacterium]|nr:phage tail tube protein [Gammaproteobacteria bacterium]